MKRRHVLVGIASVAASGTAGCLGVIGMDEHAATPAGVDPDVRADTGYEQTGIDGLVLEEAFLGDEVVVRNYLTEHDREIDLGPLGGVRAAVFIVLTTPQVSLVGQEFNPIEEMDAQELIDLVEDNYDEISNVSHDTDEEVTILDQETTNARFEADAEFDGYEFPVYVHITEAVQTDDDHLVTIGVYPQEIHDNEDENVGEMMQGVIPEADGHDQGDRDEDGADGDGDGGDEEGDEDGDDEAGDGEEDDGDDTVDDGDADGDDEDDEGDEEDDDGLIGD